MIDATAFAVIASDHVLAQATKRRLEEKYTFTTPEQAERIIVLGGDGMLLKILREYEDKTVYGINCGTVGFLMNRFNEDLGSIFDRIHHAQIQTLHPLNMSATDIHGKTHACRAINEVALFRTTAQAAKIMISVDKKVRMQELSCDGILVATPAGSTAYNLSAHGPIIPLGANLLALTPISPFRPRRWRGALLPDTSVVDIKVLEADVRRVHASCDDQEIVEISEIRVSMDKTKSYTLLFDADHHLEERIISEQFFA